MFLKCKIFGEKECAAYNQVRTGKPVENNNNKNAILLVQPELECLF